MLVDAPLINRLASRHTDCLLLRLRHGPIDAQVQVECDPAYHQQISQALSDRFSGLLQSIVDELSDLRSPLSAECPDTNVAPLALSSQMMFPPNGAGACDPCLTTTHPQSISVPQQMRLAATQVRDFNVTPMIAVAGAVADILLGVILGAAQSHVEEGPTPQQTMPAQPIRRAWVNNGGDIAVYLNEASKFVCGWVQKLADAGPSGQLSFRGGDGVGGVCTSGREGRSFSLGIADSVSVLARNAALADAAATVIANAVDLPGHSAIKRVPANELAPDSDLGSRLVVVGTGVLDSSDIRNALARGRRRAELLCQRGIIRTAALSLAGEVELVRR